MKKLKYFLVSLNILFSRSFLYSQSKASEILKDMLLSRLKGLDREFQVTIGNTAVNLPEIDTSKLEKKNRGNSNSSYSSSYELDHVPEIFHDIIDQNIQNISNYLGRDFLYENPVVFRNYKIPQEFYNYDIYSNIWHQDSHDGNRFLKIFILTHTVNADDGPFIFLEYKDVKKYWHDLKDRWSWNSMKETKRFKEEIQLIGERNDFLILDSSRSMHRASIPKTSRDILQICLYPKWRKNNSRYKFI